MAASLAAGAFTTPAAHAAGVVIRLPDREMRIDESTLRDAADVPAGTSTLRVQGSAGDAIAHPPAVSLPRVLELAGVAPGAVSFVSVQRPNGTLCVLHAADLSHPAPFPEGPPLVWLDADSVRFLRPVRDDADANAADNIATAGEDLAVRVHQGPLLEVTVRVAPPRPRTRTRTRVRLEARISGASRGAALTVRWRFGDGTEATGPAVSHGWSRAGVYAVVATAEGDDDSGGASEPLVVRVSAPRERAGRVGGGSGDPERSPATGPSEPPVDEPPAQPDASDPTPQAESTGRSSPPASSPAPAAAVSPRASSPRASSPAPAMRRSRRPRVRRGDAPPGSVPVRGILVASTMPAAAPAAGPSPPLAAARTGGPPEHRDAMLAAGGTLACALFALGACRERRRRRP